MSESGQDAPLILPNKRYFRIQEVSELCQVKDHTLRYWEKNIPELKPRRRRGNHRRYQREDIHLIRKIKALTEEGYTLEGVREKLQDRSPTPWDTERAQAIQQAITELERIAGLLRE